MENNDSNFKLLVAKAKLGELKGQKMLIEQAINFLNKTDNSSKEVQDQIYRGKLKFLEMILQHIDNKETLLPRDSSEKNIIKPLNSEKEIVSVHSDISQITTLFPNTLEERQRVHWGLCSYVFNNDGHKGLTGFLKKITNNDDLQKILRWLDIYSTVEIENQVNEAYLFRKKKNSEQFSPKLGREKPYYEMHVMSKAERFKALTLLPPSTRGATQKSNKAFQKKVLKSYLDDFLNDPTLENKKRLIDEIDTFANTPPAKRGSPFLRGGSPGLGKNR